MLQNSCNALVIYLCKIWTLASNQLGPSLSEHAHTHARTHTCAHTHTHTYTHTHTHIHTHATCTHTVCNEWQKVNYPGLPGNAGRYGHSALLDPTNNSTFVFGGFQGTLLSDLLRFATGMCQPRSQAPAVHVTCPLTIQEAWWEVSLAPRPNFYEPCRLTKKIGSEQFHQENWGQYTSQSVSNCRYNYNISYQQLKLWGN